MIRRVLMTADTIGGVWTYALELIHELRDVQFALATMGRPLSPTQAAEASDLPNLEVFESGYRLEWMEEPWHDVRAAGRWLLSLEKAFRPDLVHLNGYVHGSLPFEAPKLVVAHSCVLSWWRAVKGEEAPPTWDRYREEVQSGLSAADLVAAPTRAMLDEATHFYGPFKRTAILSNGSAGVEPGPKEPFVFAAGRMWDEAKNVRALESIECAWPIRIAGEGSALGQLSPEETRAQMARASIYALPARYEPFGLSILEAASAECALVLGDIPSLRENWEGRAFFVDPDDTKGLRSTIDCLIADPALRTRMGKAARERALSLSAERFGRAYRRTYQDLISSGALITRRLAEAV
jgi:glycogen synthase